MQKLNNKEKIDRIALKNQFQSVFTTDVVYQTNLDPDETTRIINLTKSTNINDLESLNNQ